MIFFFAFLATKFFLASNAELVVGNRIMGAACPKARAEIPGFLEKVLDGPKKLSNCANNKEGIFSDSNGMPIACMDRFQLYVNAHFSMPNHIADPVLTDDEYSNLIDQKYPIPSAVLKAMESGFYNSIRTNSATWEKEDANLEDAVNELKAKLISINPNAKVIRFSSRHAVALGGDGAASLIKGKGRILVFLPGTEQNPVDHLIQFVVPDKENPDLRSGQMSIIAIDHSKSPTKTFYRDDWRIYDNNDHFLKLVKRQSTAPGDRRCITCHLSGALAIHPGDFDQKRYGEDMSSINQGIETYGPQSHYKNTANEPPSLGSGGDDPKYNYFNKNLFDACIPESDFTDKQMRQKTIDSIKKSMASCVDCHDSRTGSRTSLGPEAFGDPTVIGGVGIQDRIVSVRDFIDQKKSIHDLSHAMPPGVQLGKKERLYLNNCLIKSYFGSEKDGIRGQFTDWLLRRDDADPKLASCFFYNVSTKCNSSILPVDITAPAASLKSAIENNIIH